MDEGFAKQDELNKSGGSRRQAELVCKWNSHLRAGRLVCLLPFGCLPTPVFPSRT